MSSIVKNNKMSFLDVRNKPEWKLLDLRAETGDYEFELYSSVISEFADISRIWYWILYNGTKSYWSYIWWI